MKIILTFCLVLGCFSNFINAQTINPNYDKNLAKKLGADDYGMKTYVLAILKTGDNSSDDEAAKVEAFKGHMSNMTLMVENYQLIVAGPIEKNDNEYRGIFILNADSLDKAKIILESDPAIRDGYLDADLYLWYGSAALSAYLETSDKVWKKGF